MYKKVLRKYWERTILKQIFLCTFGISALFITIACFIGFSFVQKAKVNELIQNDKETLNSYYTVIENNIESAQKLIETLYRSVYVQRILVTSETKWNDNMSVVTNNILSSITLNPSLHSIYLFGKNGIVLKSSNHPYPTTKEVDEKATAAFQDSFLRQINPWSYQDIYGKTQETVSLTLGNLAKDGETFESGIEVNIAMGNMVKDLFPKTVPQENYVIVSTQGDVLGSSGEDYHFGENVSNDTFIQYVLTQKNKSDTVKLEKNKTNYTINYITSSDGNYYVIHIYPYSTIMKSIAYYRNIAILAGISFVFVSLLISAIVAFLVYHPIDEVMEYASLVEPTDTSHIEKRSSKYKELSVISEKMRLMARQLNHFNEEKENDTMIHYLDSRHIGSKVPLVFSNYFNQSSNVTYSCVILRICNIDKVINEEQESNILKQIDVICSIAKTNYEKIAQVLLYVIDSEYVSIILIHKTKEDYPLIMQQSKKILSEIQTENLFAINIGISIQNEDIDQLNQVYHTAKAITKYRFLFGENSIITEEQIQESSFRGSGKEFELRQLMCGVKKLNKDMFIQEFKKLDEFLKLYSLQTAYDLLISLACEMFLYHNEITQYRSSLGFLDYENAQKEILSFQYISEALPWFLILFDKIEDTIQEAQKKGTSEIVDKAVKHIMEHYNDVNLSAQQLSDLLNITPSYFSRIFNDYTNCAFPDYLTNIRLEQAKRILIEEPNSSIQSICEEVGYLSSSYFTAQFKKKYGIPPSKYRLNNHIK